MEVPEELRDGYGEVVRFYLTEFRALRRRVEVEGRRYRDDDGKQVVSPLVGLRDKAADTFHKFLKDYPAVAATPAEQAKLAEVVDARAELEKRWAAQKRKAGAG